MLLSDAALSVQERHLHAVSAIKGNLRQIKVLGFSVLFCFSSPLFAESTRQQFCWLCSALGVLFFPSQHDRT